MQQDIKISFHVLCLMLYRIKRDEVQFISISWLNGSLHLHLRPINLVIFQEIVLVQALGIA